MLVSEDQAFCISRGEGICLLCRKKMSLSGLLTKCEISSEGFVGMRYSGKEDGPEM